MTMNVQTDRSLIRERGRSVRYALLSFTAPEPTRAVARQPLSVAFVIDRSGSMGGSKIELARKAVIQALGMLRAEDRFSVIAYDDQIEVVVSQTSASQEALRNAAEEVRRIEARGSTDLAAGWLKGCEQIAQGLRDGGTTRCLLLSDGLANHGITDRDELGRHSRELGARGIRTSCLGIGDDYDERLLETIASESRGHSYHVETAVQIADILTSELGEALETVARDVVIHVQPEGKVSVKTLNRYPLVANAGRSVSLQLGDLAARQEVSLVFALKFAAGERGTGLSVTFMVSDATGTLSMPDVNIAWTFADHEVNDAQTRNRIVDRAVAQLHAATAKAEALELNRSGNFPEARKRLERTARRIEKYAGDDPTLLALVADLRKTHEVYSAPMAAADVKRAYFQSMNVSYSRSPEGKARRSPTS